MMPTELRSVPSGPDQSFEQLVNRIIASRKLTRADQQQLMLTTLSREIISEAQRQQINRVLDHLRAGKLRVVD